MITFKHAAVATGIAALAFGCKKISNVKSQKRLEELSKCPFDPGSEWAESHPFFGSWLSVGSGIETLYSFTTPFQEIVLKKSNLLTQFDGLTDRDKVIWKIGIIPMILRNSIIHHPEKMEEIIGEDYQFKLKVPSQEKSDLEDWEVDLSTGPDPKKTQTTVNQNKYSVRKAVRDAAEIYTEALLMDKRTAELTVNIVKASDDAKKESLINNCGQDDLDYILEQLYQQFYCIPEAEVEELASAIYKQKRGKK